MYFNTVEKTTCCISLVLALFKDVSSYKDKFLIAGELFCLEAVRVKYRISALHYDSCYSKLIKPRLCDFLIDERKRQLKAENRRTTTEELYLIQ